MKIIFVCAGNTCRSPMAEGIAKKHNDKTTFESRGIAAADGHYASVYSIEAMKSMGIDISHHRAKNITENDLDADKFVCMEETIKLVLQRYFNIPEEKVIVLGDGISDPYGGDLQRYEECAKQIDEALKKLEYFN